MGRLHPDDFPLATLDDGERMLVEALLEHTRSDWIIMPTVRIGNQPPVEIDVVVAHPSHGVGMIETKSYLPRVVDGTWIEPYRKVGGGPVAQMNRNRYALRDLLRERCGAAGHVEVDSAIAFVNASGFNGDGRPTGIRDEQLIWSTDLDVIDHALERFMRRGRLGRLMFDEGVFGQLVRVIRPNVEFDADPGAYARWSSGRIEERSAAQIRALERLDANRRVFVTGGAGTGKSRLALAWARRAAVRGERVLLVCFNEPLATEFERRVGMLEGLDTGAFLRLALRLDGMPNLDVPEDADSTFWNDDVQGHIHLHWPDVIARYDTVVIDEVQDFSPAWLAMLEALLDPDGPRRMLVTGDAEQELHRRGFSPPRSEDGWTVCELANNSRNALEIARLLRNRFGGPPAPASLPAATHLRFVEADDDETILAAVRAELLALRTAGFDDSDVAVVTLDRTARDLIRQVPEFVAFEQARPGFVVCETARRLKGLEYRAVVLVAGRWPIDDIVIHVGVSRAVLGLTVIGPRPLRDRLGL